MTNCTVGSSEDPEKVRNDELLGSSQPSFLAFSSILSTQKQRRPSGAGRWGESTERNPTHVRTRGPTVYTVTRVQTGLGSELSVLQIARASAHTHWEQEVLLIDATGGHTPQWAAVPTVAGKGQTPSCHSL